MTPDFTSLLDRIWPWQGQILAVSPILLEALSSIAAGHHEPAHLRFLLTRQLVEVVVERDAFLTEDQLRRIAEIIDSTLEMHSEEADHCATILVEGIANRCRGQRLNSRLMAVWGPLARAHDEAMDHFHGVVS